MGFYAKIGSKDRIFQNRASTSAYFVKEESDFYCYNITFDVDVEKALSHKLPGVEVYVTEKYGQKSERRKSSLFPQVDFDNNYQVGAHLGFQQADMTNDFLQEAARKKAFLKKISYLETLDLSKYKDNPRGTQEEKFGTETRRTITYERVTDDNLFFEGLNRQDTTNTRGLKVRSIFRNLVIDGLLSGKGMISTMNYDWLISKSALDSHVITPREEKRKSRKRIAKNEEKVQIIREYFGDILIKNNRIPKVTKSNVSRKIMRFNSEIKIPKRFLEQKKISKKSVRILLEARDRTETFTLDNLAIDLDIEKDIVYSSLTMDNLSLKSSTSSRQEPCFEFSGFFPHTKDPDYKQTGGKGTASTESNTSISVFYSYIDKLTPIFGNNYNQVAEIDLERKGGLSKHALTLSRRKYTGTSVKSSYVPPILDSPHVIRCKPTIAGVEIDNCLEASIAAKGSYQVDFINFYVKSIPANNIRSGFMEIVIPMLEIDPTIIKIKPVKINLTKHPYGGSRYYEDVRDESGRAVGFRSVRTGNKITFIDHDIEIHDKYEYRLQIMRRNATTSPEYSVNSFVEAGLYAKNAALLSVDDDAVEGNSAVSVIDVHCIIKKSEVQNIFESLIDDKFDLFQDEITEVREASSPVVSLLCEKINTRTGEVKNLGIKTASASNDGQAYVFSINDRGTSSSIYKFTPLVAPVAELITLLNNEIVKRFDARAEAQSGLNYFNFAGLKKKVAKLDNQTLSTMSLRFTGAGMQSNKLIVDPDTIVAKNAGNVMRTASTGDVIYYSNASVHGNMIDNSSTGIKFYRKATISYYPFSENKKMTKNKFNNSRINHKFVIDIACCFESDIDHCAIFSVHEDKVNFECVLHVEIDKSSYRALIERETCHDVVDFYAVPVSKRGKILAPLNLGKFRK